MTEPATPRIKPDLMLPTAGTTPTAVLGDGNLVVIGANGSGKSRLGVWLENHHKNNSHRISAQRALSFSEVTPLKQLDAAERWLRYGLERPGAGVGTRFNSRWQSRSSNFVLNDFDALLATLFARQQRRDYEHSRRANSIGIEAGSRPVAGTDVLRRLSEVDKIVSLWRLLLPHRQLDVQTDKILARVPDGTEYNGPEMSDGERVAFYLAGQVLCAPNKSILIFDEPEIHLHRAILAPLWNALEDLRTDCLFVYITHDVHFAATRANCTKIWLRAWHGNESWEWEVIPAAASLPEELLLSVLGSRRPCLFVEGEAGSLDFELLSLAYPDHYIVPRGSCDKVIETTKAYREHLEPHHVAAEGIIDRDHRSDEEISAFRERGVRVLPVAEIESVLLTPAVVKFVAVHQKLDPEVILLDVQATVTSALQGELDTQIRGRARARSRLALSGFVAGSGGQREFVDSLDKFKQTIDPSAIWREADEAFNAVLRHDDYEAILRLYNRKSLVMQVAKCFSLGGAGYLDLCRRLARADDETGRELRRILRAEIER